jgi:hypothetical protein
LDIIYYSKSWEKTETAIILIGDQGTGKNKFFTNVISKLFGRYAIQNENNINNIIGRFNSNIENKILVICNELQSIDSNKVSNFDGLKSLITDKKINVESKYLNIREIKNVSNFIFVSNNSMPIKIDHRDRRYVVCKCSDIYKNNFEYFSNLYKTFTHDFYINLFRYFKEYNILNFERRIIPITIMKHEIMQACKES